MIDVLRIAHLRIAPQEGNSEVGNCEVHLTIIFILTRLVDCGHASPSPASPMVIMMITDQSYSDCVDDGLMIDLKSEN